MATEYAKHETTGFLLKGILETIDAMDNLEDVAALGSELNNIIAHARQRWQDLRTSPVQVPTIAEQVSANVAAANMAAALDIIDGVYRVDLGNDDVVTLKFKTQADDSTFMPGRQVVYRLIGTGESWRDFQCIATLDSGIMRTFRKHQGTVGREEMAVRMLQATSDYQLECAISYGKQTGRCGICGRELTNPESIAAGIGPICAGRFG